MESKAKLLELTRNRLSTSTTEEVDLQVAKLEAKIRKIESDVLFDKASADHEWKSKKVLIEKNLAASRVKQEVAPEPEQASPPPPPKDDDINDEAERIAAEILAEKEDDFDDIGGLFDTLPQSEVDPSTGESKTVITSANGAKTYIRDFGKWAGVSPRKVLEDACRSRDSSVKLTYTVLSELAFANRHAVDISWSKPQALLPPSVLPDVEVFSDATWFAFSMEGIATPDRKQSEAFIATVALFQIFSQNPREEKVHLKLPPVWRDFWTELAEAKKSESDSKDRAVVRELRDLVRQRSDQELEDGVILQGAFRGRSGAKPTHDSTANGRQTKLKPNLGSDFYKKIWHDKSSTDKYQAMLVSSRYRVSSQRGEKLTLFTEISNAVAHVEF